MTIWDCRTHVRMTSMTSSVERTDLDFKISVALVRSTPLDNDVEPLHKAKYKTMEKGVLFNKMQYMHSFAMNSGGKFHVKI